MVVFTVIPYLFWGQSRHLSDIPVEAMKTYQDKNS